jgi:hypothetical protein
VKVKKIGVVLLTLSAILMLVGWSQTSRLPAGSPSDVGAAVNHPRVEVPDYPLDGEVFVVEFVGRRGAAEAQLSPDDREDGRVYVEFFRRTDMTSQNANPDDRADGLIFQQWYAEQLDGEGDLAVPDYPADAWMFRSE